VAQTPREITEAFSCLKDQSDDDTISWALDGEERISVPDFLAVLDDGRGSDDAQNLIIEVTVERKAENDAKDATARVLRAAAMNLREIPLPMSVR
jgi:hypothetical protein